MRELSNTIGQLQAREQELLTKLKLKVCYKVLHSTCLIFPKLRYSMAMLSDQRTWICTCTGQFIKVLPCPESKLVEHNNTCSNYWQSHFFDNNSDLYFVSSKDNDIMEANVSLGELQQKIKRLEGLCQVSACTSSL